MAADVEALPGSVSQLRECALRFLQLAKSSGTPIFLVGHVTKDGSIAGPKVLEHMVDTVLYLEGERFNQYRLLRSTKNRFGPTQEVGVFEMQGQGLVEVAQPVVGVSGRARHGRAWLGRHGGHGGHAAAAARDPGAGQQVVAGDAAPHRNRLRLQPAAPGDGGR